MGVADPQRWQPFQRDLVADRQRSWAWAAAPSVDDHEHCFLCWETIEQGRGPSAGWCSDDDWLCDDCHQRYVVDDELGLRA